MVVEEKPLAEIFEKTAKLIESISPKETCCTLKIVDQSDLSLKIAAAPSLPAELTADLERLEVRPEDGTCGLAVTSRETVVSEDVATDPDNLAYREIALKHGIKSCWSVPVLDKAGEPLAVITSFFKTRYTPSEARLQRITSMCQLIRLAIERRDASEALVRSNEKFKSAAAATNDAVWDWDITKDTLWWNEGFSKLFGFGGQGPGPTLQGWSDRIHPEDRDRVMNSLTEASVGDGKHWVCEYRFLRDDGSAAHVIDQAEVIFNNEGKAVRMIGGMSDMTVHRQTEFELKKLNRAFEMLGSCNRMLIRANDEKQLLDDICTIATDVGGYRTAWVGFAGTGEDKPIIPIARKGDTGGYTDAIRLSYSENHPAGKGPGGRTIRTGKAVICEDIRKASSDFSWKEEALRRGYRSLVCLPFKDGDTCFGFISLLSENINAIGQDELSLLCELADNVAFGISALRSSARQKTMQDTIVKVAQTVSGSTGKQFYQLLAKNMVAALGASGGVIGRINRENDTVTTLAYVSGDTLQENVTYDLKGTPCAEVRSKSVCIFEDDLPELFPEDHYLIELGIRSYAGIALYDARDVAVGVLSVLFKDPLEDPAMVKSILRIFAERVASEMARQEADAHIFNQASLIDKARDAILTFDLDHRITFWNKSAGRLYGFPDGELSGKHAFDLLDGRREQYDRAFSATTDTGEWLGELHQANSDGKTLIVESRWNLVRGAEGEPLSILAINTDITEHKNLERQFLRAQRLESIGTLAGGLAHDLNNVLAPISMSIELLRKSISDERGNELLDAISQSSRRGADMVSQILSFARGVEGRRVPVSGTEILSGLSGIIRDTFPKSVLIETSVPDGLWQVIGDSTQLNQILLNLCVNSRDAMPDGGKLFVSASNETIGTDYAAANLDATPGPHVCIEVEDTGHGIHPDIIDRIYDPFFTTKDIGKGTGLGLSTTLAIVKSHGGFIRSYSEPDKGTRIRVHLPALPSPSSPETASAAPPSLIQGNGETILIIDDEPAILEMTRRILESFGYRTLIAESGIRALGIFRKSHHGISAIVTDMMMPGLDGPGTIHGLLEIDSSAKIIAVSGIRANGEIALASGEGVRHFLQKPFTTESLLNALADLINEQNPTSKDEKNP